MSQAEDQPSRDFAAALRALVEFAEEILPRILTQIDRDRLSPTHGCADRDWWHYKIRDFPSLILQQAAETVWHASGLHDDYSDTSRAAMRELSAASCRFWNSRAIRRGAFEEFYPHERSYPPLAFSTLSVAKLAAAGAVLLPDVERGLRAAASQLLRRFESQASNQQVAGLAAVAWLRRVIPDAVPQRSLDRLATRSLALQDAEGWYTEYDGPDLGYLSVTVDCLWDAYDATGDERYLHSLDRAIEFTATMVALCEGSPGMLNSRNTDYVLPYGLLRAAVDRPGHIATRAAAAVGALLESLRSTGHPLRAVDDRYLAHYIGNSVMRAALLARNWPGSREWGDDPAEDAKKPILHLPSAGYIQLRDTSGGAITIAGNKGGVFTGGFQDSASVADYGWSVRDHGRALISHWWSTDWTVEVEDWTVTVHGHLVPYKAVSSTPIRHLALRLMAIIFGSRIKPFLKRRMILRPPSKSMPFTRTIHLRGEAIEVVDRISGIPRGATVVRSPRASKRYIPSANWAHPEDFELLTAVEVDDEIVHSDGIFEARTRYRAR